MKNLIPPPDTSEYNNAIVAIALLFNSSPQTEPKDSELQPHITNVMNTSFGYINYTGNLPNQNVNFVSNLVGDIMKEMRISNDTHPDLSAQINIRISQLVLGK